MKIVRRFVMCTVTHYSDNGLPTYQKTEDGGEVWYEYNEHGDLTYEGNHRDSEIRYNYVYDSNNRMVKKKDSLGRIWSYDYDGRGNKVYTKTPDGTEIHMFYDDHDNVVTTEIKSSYPGHKNSSTYNTSYVYEGDNIISKKDDMARTMTTYQYKDGKLISDTVTSLDSGNEITHEYNEHGDIVTTIDANGKKSRIKRKYDDAGRISSMEDLNYGVIETYTYF